MVRRITNPSNNFIRDCKSRIANVIGAVTLFLAIFCIPFLSFAQDTIITNSIGTGKGKMINGKEVGHWHWNKTLYQTREDWYYLDSNMILVIERENNLLNLSGISILKQNKDGLLSTTKQFVFSSSDSISLNLLMFHENNVDSTFNKSTAYYENGVKKCDSYLMKSNRNCRRYKLYDSLGLMTELDVYTDSNASKTLYYVNGQIRSIQQYIVNPELNLHKLGSLTPTLLDENYIKHGIWIYYTEKGEVYLKEYYENNILIKTTKR